MSYPATLPLIGKESDKKKKHHQRRTPLLWPWGKLGGLKDGKARMKQISVKRRTEIARTPAKARWKHS